MASFVLVSEGLDRSIGALMMDFGVPVELMDNIKPSERDQYVPRGIFIIVNLYQRHISFDLKDPTNDHIWHADNFQHFASLCTLLNLPLPTPKRLSPRERMMKKLTG